MTGYVYKRSSDGSWTVGFYAPDGSWHSDTVQESADAAAQRVHWLNGGGALNVIPQKTEQPVEPIDEQSNKYLDNAVDWLELSSRATNCLRYVEIYTVSELLACSEKELLGIKNFGRVSLREINETLANYGLRLPTEAERSRITCSCGHSFSRHKLAHACQAHGCSCTHAVKSMTKIAS